RTGKGERRLVLRVAEGGGAIGEERRRVRRDRRAGGATVARRAPHTRASRSEGVCARARKSRLQESETRPGQEDGATHDARDAARPRRDRERLCRRRSAE